MKPIFPWRSKSYARVIGVLAMAVMSWQALIAAEGPIVAVQDALKREHLYTGEPSGVIDEPTRAALRQFQTQRGLPVSGELDTATLQALQGTPPKDSGTGTAPGAGPVSIPAGPSSTTIEKDREFLQNLPQTGPEPGKATAVPTAPPEAPAPVVSAPSPQPPVSVPPAAPVVQVPADPAPVADLPRTEPPPPKPAIAPKREAVVADVPRPSPEHKPETVRNSPVETPQAIAARKVARRVGEKELPAPQRRVESRPAAIAATPAETDNDPDPLGPHGVKIIRSTTTSRVDGRTRVVERTTSVVPASPAPTAVIPPARSTETAPRAIPVDPPKKDDGFLHRLFNGKDKDD